MNKDKIKKYFERLNLDIDIDNMILDYDLIKNLQYAHVTNIAYENFDILIDKPIDLDNDALFEKMINNNRGGYCFEINSLFNWLLSELGFKTTNYMARYLRGESETPMRRHRVIIVESESLDGKYMCDAGIGERAPRYPLKLQEELEQEQFGEIYKFVKDEFYGWMIVDYHNGEWSPFFAFTEEIQLDKDYVMPSFYCEKHPDSPFNKTNIFAVKTENGRKTINDKSFKIFSGDDVKETYIENFNMLKEILKDHFFITL